MAKYFKIIPTSTELPDVLIFKTPEGEITLLAYMGDGTYVRQQLCKATEEMAAAIISDYSLDSAEKWVNDCIVS